MEIPMNHHVVTCGRSSLSKQAGAVTLLTSVMIMLLATILVVAVSRTTLMEQRISGNEIRTRMAHEAAEAGLNFGLAYLTQTTDSGGATVPMGADKDKNTFADPIALTTLTGTPTKYSIRFFDPRMGLAAISCPSDPGPVDCDCNSPAAIAANACPSPASPPIDPPITCGVSPTFSATPPTYLRTPRIVACGWSDDGLGRAMLSQGLGTVPAISNPVTMPLTSKGAVDVQGSATITNYYNNFTVWSGDDVTTMGNSGKTFMRNPNVPPPANSVPPPPPPSACSTSDDYVCLTQKDLIGLDVIANDIQLSNLTDADMFKVYFGQDDVAAYSANVASMADVAPGNVGTLNGVKQESFVVTGSITNTMNFTIGSRDQPVVMIVDGDWTGGGNTTVYGIVYVTGNIALTGTKTVYGGMVVEGTVSGTGSLDIIYDPLVADNAANNVGRAGSIPGSWRDWK
jgi:hypothetical protein